MQIKHNVTPVKDHKCHWKIVMLHFVTPAPSLCPISPREVRNLWAQLRRDEPHLLSNFEDFLARVTSQIIEANQERREMESALQRSKPRLCIFFLSCWFVLHSILQGLRKSKLITYVTVFSDKQKTKDIWNSSLWDFVYLVQAIKSTHLQVRLLSPLNKTGFQSM